MIFSRNRLSTCCFPSVFLSNGHGKLLSSFGVWQLGLNLQRENISFAGTFTTAFVGLPTLIFAA